MCAGHEKYGAHMVLNAKKPPEQGVTSVGSPSQASAEGALLQLRNLVSLQFNEVGSHPDHSPHSAQVAAAPAEKKIKEKICNFLFGNG